MNIPIYVEKLYKYDLPQEVCSVAVPMKQGDVKEQDLARLAVVDEKGKEVLSDLKITAKWPDGSVKYLFICMAPDLLANQNMTFYLTDEKEIAKEATSTLCVTEGTQEITVSTGAITFTVKDNTASIFAEVVTKDARYEDGQFIGPVLKVDGKKQNLWVDTWKIVEAGKVAVVLEGAGHYENRRVAVRLRAMTGKDYVELGLRLFNDSMESLVPDSWNLYVNRYPGVCVDDGLSTKQVAFDSTGCGDMNENRAGENSLHFWTTGTGKLAEIEQQIAAQDGEYVRTLTGISNYKTRFAISFSSVR